MEAYLSIIIAVIGLIVYAISNNPKAMELGRLSFFAGLLAFLIVAGSHVTSLAR